MTESIRFQVKKGREGKWADLGSLGRVHEIIGENFTKKDENYSFIGNHRVRRYKVKDNVHVRIPEGTALDISGVTPRQQPPARA